MPISKRIILTKSSLGLIIAGLLGLCAFKNYRLKEISQATADCEVKIFPKQESGIVSHNLMGFNIVYCFETDAQWQEGSGNIPQLLNKIGTRQMRYPGGTVTTFYHWNNPTGQGWADSWNPAFNSAKNLKDEEFTDLDEYLAITQKTKTEPLIGINMASGKKHNRVADGLGEAKKLVQHCLSKGIKVKYYYLDNEPYQHDANYQYKPEEYAEQVNLYVPEMRKIDPNIKIIVNTHPNPNSINYTKTVLKLAGKNIDYVDIHMYWRYNSATFENWKATPRMLHDFKNPYSEQRRIFKQAFAESGHPDIELMSLEWNIGPSGKGNAVPSEAEMALMVGEQFNQFMQADLFMACFWPISWPRGGWENQALTNAGKNYTPTKVYDMFKLYTEALGQQKIKSSASSERIIPVTVKSKDGKTIWVYLINKNQNTPAMRVALNIEGFKVKKSKAEGFSSQDKTSGPLQIESFKINRQDASHFTVTMPRNSFAKITLKK